MRAQWHRHIYLILAGMLISMTNANAAHASMATSGELAAARQWFAARFTTATPDPPFSFTYGGHASSELLPTWRLARARRNLDDHRSECTLTYTDPKTGLVVRCVAVQWKDFPTVEWTLFFKNAGSSDTPILENIQAMDVSFRRHGSEEFTLHHNRGDFCAVNSFEPLEAVLEAGSERHFAPDGGRPTNGQWPYYNLGWGGGGVIIAIGWPGQWASTFTRDTGTGLRIRAGQELTHFSLHAGEEVRAPLIVLQFYRGDWIRGQNMWRRWMLAHNFPKPQGKALAPVLAGCSGWQFPGLMCNQAGEIEFINRYLAEGIKLDYWWMDAGWYPCDGVGWPKVGTWEVDKTRYPGGLRAVTDHAHAKGVKGLVWFEPERVHPGTWLYDNHPEWLLGRDGDTKLLNLGNAEARRWLTDHIDHLLTEQGIDLYRQDFNIDPLGFWRANDAEDRQGITEIRHIEGYLAYWDELRRRHPGMLIDSCASGGRRDDLETMRRAVPLLRTDFEFQSTGNQCCTYGFDMWLPYHECGNRDIDAYAFRSNMAVWMGFVWDVRRKDLNYALGRRLVGQWRQVADCYLGDFYPLTPYSTADDVWMAWQFDRPDLDRGMVQAFCRPDCIYESARLKLRGLDPSATYQVRDLDQPRATKMTGREMMETGLLVRIPAQPGAVVIRYDRVKS
jgi:alpha-galactosidase